MGTAIRLFVCGDVMTGRGIDQILAHPGDPRLHESWVSDARDYVALAGQSGGAIAAPVSDADVWGDALAELASRAPDLRLINLETSITTRDDYWSAKGIHYRMSPANIGCLTVAGIDCCVLGNNHVLDWGHAGLLETLETLERAGIAVAGAGRDRRAAAAPAVFDVGSRGRVLVLSLGFADSGIPAGWAATNDRPGVNRFSVPCREALERLAASLAGVRRPGDLVVASVHWGGNWGYAVAAEQRDFGHRLVDELGVALVHGHSSHHPKAIEVYRGRPLLYGCGDFINDYEGIAGHETYRGDLALMYFPDIDPLDGRLLAMELVPMRRQRLRLNRASPADRQWLVQMLNREGEKYGTAVQSDGAGGLLLEWW